MAAAPAQVLQVPTESAGMFESFDEKDLDLCDDDVSASMFEGIVGSSGAIIRVREQILKVASSYATVLITGESGTGKELIARAVHRRSNRFALAFRLYELRG